MTPYMTPSGFLKKGKGVIMHGKLVKSPQTEVYQAFLSSPVIGSVFGDVSGIAIPGAASVDTGIVLTKTSLTTGPQAIPTSLIYGTPPETPGLYVGLTVYSSLMHVTPVCAEANRAGVWYTGSATIGELFGASGGQPINT